MCRFVKSELSARYFRCLRRTDYWFLLLFKIIIRSLFCVPHIIIICLPTRSRHHHMTRTRVARTCASLDRFGEEPREARWLITINNSTSRAAWNRRENYCVSKGYWRRCHYLIERQFITSWDINEERRKRESRVVEIKSDGRCKAATPRCWSKSSV